jgi:hypothetical protein
MTDHLPIACSLGAADLAERLNQISDLGRDALVDARRDGARAELRFAARPGVRERVAAIAAAEARCCAYLDLRVGDGAGAVVLQIGAPAGAEPVLAELVDAFRQSV